MKKIIRGWKKIVKFCDWLDEKTGTGFYFSIFMLNIIILPVIILLEIYYP